MYHFRPFRNSDPPRIAEIWRDQPPQRGLMQPVTAGLLEQLVFSKPYFDPDGLIVAAQRRYGPSASCMPALARTTSKPALTTDIGTTYQLMLRADHRNDALADELLARSEEYLRERGAKVIYAGGIRPLNAFYLGLYGGSELPGVLVERSRVQRGLPAERLSRNRSRASSCSSSWPASGRRSRATSGSCAAKSTCQEMHTPPVRIVVGSVHDRRLRADSFLAHAAGGSEPLADVWFWDIEPLSTSWGAPTAGMFDLQRAERQRRKGLATFLLGEAFERLRNRGIVLVEAQTMQHNAPALALYEKLGFKKVDEGVVYRKDA